MLRGAPRQSNPAGLADALPLAAGSRIAQFLSHRVGQFLKTLYNLGMLVGHVVTFP